MKKIFFLLLFAPLLLTACNKKPEAGAIPTVEELIARRDNITQHEAEVYCQENNGKLEKWGNGKTYCIFTNGYGCDPMEYAKGICGTFAD